MALRPRCALARIRSDSSTVRSCSTPFSSAPGIETGRFRPPGCHEQPVVADPLTIFHLHVFLLGVDGRGPRSEPQLDTLLGIDAGRVYQLVLEALLTAQVGLGERWAVVRQLALGADELDLTVETLVPQCHRSGRAGQGGSDDYDLLWIHTCPRPVS